VAEALPPLLCAAMWGEEDEDIEEGEGGEASDAMGHDPIVVIPIEESFDLHQFHPSEAISMLDAYLEAAVEAGFREVRLIHGRGKGVQRAQVRKWLGRDDRVEHFEEAPPGRGGWGATLAWLRAGRGSSTPAPGGRALRPEPADGET